MSHRDDCPSEWEARRRGERDYEDRGYRSYHTPYDGQCEEAVEAYRRAQRSAEYDAQDRAEAREAHRRAVQQREYAEAEEAYQEQQQEVEPEPEPDNGQTK